ncbi:ligand-binding sensor domain-containing protein [Engelhardtia mirabilis]|uniref:Two component regulator propeller n=1 Tax=Engelhardtia mirabilis TaxID=2528011 RepID=A0A518BPU2_9BACT|nr:Two component regulator propeller [Planctomycetes bacterium Pla133]QDV03316.1 Two component regulator propeller [Planctomycetes bacterium Pla86]
MLLCCLVANAAIALVGQEPAEAAPPEVDPPSGRVVTEIDPRIWCVFEAQNGDLWLGSNGDGVYRYDGERAIHYTEADGLVGSQVRDIEQHVSGDVLVSTTGGVARFDGTRWSALAVEEPPEGGGWLLDENDTWLVVDPGHGGPCRYDGQHLYRLELPPGPRPAEPPDSNASFAPDGVYTIHRDRRGHLWFGTAVAGLSRFDGEKLAWMYEERLTTTPTGGAFGIRSIHEDRAGRFWICNTRQSFRVAPESRREGGFETLQYERSAGLPGADSDAAPNFTYFPSVTETDDGTLWFACGAGGVWRHDGESVTHFALGDEAYALSILGARDGKLWVGTLTQGVYVFDGERFAPLELDGSE